MTFGRNFSVSGGLRSLSVLVNTFYRAANGIFAKIGRFGRLAFEEVQLLKQKCLPILLYALDVCNLDKRTMQSLDFTMNRFLNDIIKDFQHGDCKSLPNTVWMWVAQYFVETAISEIHCCVVMLNNNNNNNNPIYKAPKALASEALAAGQSWVLLKSLTEEVRLKPRFKDRQWVSADYCVRQRVPDSWRRTTKSSSREVCPGERLVQ